MTNEEKQLLECYKKMREIYKDKTLIICCPSVYGGYNIKTGKRIHLEVVEDDWKRNKTSTSRIQKVFNDCTKRIKA